MKHINHGFSLIELIISLVVISILVSIAYPSYLEHIKKAKRAEAQSALILLASSLEEWKLSNNGVYTDGVTDPTASAVLSDQVPVTGGNKTYSLSITQVTANSFTIQANSVDGDSCDPMTYDSLGQKTAGKSDCWN